MTDSHPPERSRDALPPIPAIRRRILLSKKQKFTLPFLFAIPCLALFGVFGERAEHTTMSVSTLRADVTYPSRLRYRQTQPLTVRIRNQSTGPLDTVFVSFDTAYITRFSSPAFYPAPLVAYTIPLYDLQAGEQRLVQVALNGDTYGRHAGKIVVRSRNVQMAAPISTITFP
jgi:hypothetical protein